MTQKELFADAGIRIDRHLAGGVWRLFINDVCVDQRKSKSSLTKFAKFVVEEARVTGGSRNVLLTCRMIQSTVNLHPSIAEYIREG
jgi:hypothetical protein